mgnify:CR=1 FL=1
MACSYRKKFRKNFRERLLSVACPWPVGKEMPYGAYRRNENENRVSLLRNCRSDRAFVRILRFGMRVAMLSVLTKYESESKRL